YCVRKFCLSQVAMRPRLEDGRLQITAAAALLENSRLVHWNTDGSQFKVLDRDDFELAWQSEVDPVFGRLISWILFAAGAEFLAKGLCLIKASKFAPLKKYPITLKTILIHGCSSLGKTGDATERFRPRISERSEVSPGRTHAPIRLRL